VGTAVALYTDDIVWESPASGQVYRSAAVTEAAYRDIFETMQITAMTQLRQGLRAVARGRQRQRPRRHSGDRDRDHAPAVTVLYRRTRNDEE
jgi:ketosteroid isomerase-like protein